MVKEVQITCIICPLGCKGTVIINDAGNIEVKNYRCEKGATYAITEYTSPKRILTTTILVEGSSRKLLPVRTSKPIPKNLLMDMMIYLSQIKVKPPVKINQVIVKNIAGTEADIIATDEIHA